MERKKTVCGLLVVQTVADETHKINKLKQNLAVIFELNLLSSLRRETAAAAFDQ